MLNWLKDRLFERSTYLGLVSVMGAATQIVSMMPNQADSAADMAVATEGLSHVLNGVATGDYAGAAVAGAAAVGSIISRERGKKNAY